MSTQSAKERLAAIMAAKRQEPGQSSPAQEPVANKPTTSAEPVASATPKVPAVPQAPSQVTGTPIGRKLEELRTAIEANLPELPHVLKTIHTQLAQDPETVTLLTEEEIGLIVRGLVSHTDTTIIPKPKRGSSKRTQPISLDMLE